MPLILRDQITEGIQEFLWVETGNEIEGTLRALFAEYRAAVDVAVATVDRESYHDLAKGCWEIIAENC